MKKYQFCIRFKNTITNSAANKAVEDCNKLYSELEYADYTLTYWDNSNRLTYYCSLAKELFKVFLSIKRGSLIAVQYPLLSINHVFKYFIKAAKTKNVKFFCVIHDLESLRTGAKDQEAVLREADNLNQYDCVIAHNEDMKQWLKNHQVKTKIISLEIFDYLYPANNRNRSLRHNGEGRNTIVFAGNLRKSKFIYELGEVDEWNFNVYGPGFESQGGLGKNVHWCGEYSPDEIVHYLDGAFGLIWDGERIDECDPNLGNYLKYNNPHKFSLYLAAGLPVIAPADSAIGKLISNLNIGLLVPDLHKLNEIRIDEDTYQEMKQNVGKLTEDIRRGSFFKRAVQLAEKELGYAV